MKKKFLLPLAALAFSGTFCTAQTPQKSNATDKSTVYTTAEVMPEPSVNVQDFLSKNLDYPKDARQRKVEGRVVIKFVVAEDGSVTNAIVERGVDPVLDAEALKTVMGMPKWRPGKKDGKPVKVYYRIPVSFKLS